MKKTLILAGLWLFIAAAAFGQAQFVYGYGVGTGWDFDETSYRASTLEEALVLYTAEKYKVTAVILHAGYNNIGKFETFIVRGPAWPHSPNDMGPMLFMGMRAMLDSRYTRLFREAAEKKYNGIMVVLYIRRNLSEGGDAVMNSEFIIDAIHFPFALIQ
jgi:hypothetical protein